MVEHQSKEVIDKISDELKMQPAMSIPREISKNIQLVYEVNPIRRVQVAVGVAVDTTSATVFTTHATKDTFVTSISLSVSKDVVNTSAASRVQLFPVGGAVVHVVRINYEPVTAGSHDKTVLFNPPIKLERNSVVNIINLTGLASIDASAIVTFYETDPQ